MIYIENICKAPITVGETRVAPKELAAVDVDEKHKGVALAVQNKMLKLTTKKEFDAYTATKNGKEAPVEIEKPEEKK